MGDRAPRLKPRTLRRAEHVARRLVSNRRRRSLQRQRNTSNTHPNSGGLHVVHSLQAGDSGGLGAGGALVSTEGQRITELTFSYGGRCPRRARWRLGRRRELRVRAVDPLTATTADGLSISRRLGAVGAAMAD